jgi:hypothetical protein
MGRVEPDAHTGQELSRVFVAFKLRDARRAEDVLSANDVAYVVTVEAFGRTLFGSLRNGAVFAVAEDAASHAAALLARAGLGMGLLVDKP